MRAIRYKQLNNTQSYRLRGTYQQTDTGMLYLNSQQQTFAGPGSTLITNRFPGVSFGFIQVTVRSAGPFIGGVGVRLTNDLWIAGTWTNATTTFARSTALQTSTTSQALETANASDGFVVLSRVPFNSVTMNVTTAETGTAPVWDFAYTAPTGWTQVTPANLAVNDFQTTLLVAGEAMAMWDPPSDWTLTSGTTYGTAVPSGYFGVRFRATTPAGTNKLAVTGMEAALIAIQSAGPAGGLGNTTPQTATYSPVLSSAETQVPYGDGIVAVFAQAGVQAATNFGNSVDASFREGIV